MQGLARVGRWLVVGAVLAGSQLLSPSAEAARFANSHRHSQLNLPASMRAETVSFGSFGHRGTKRAFAKGTKVRYGSSNVLQCVPFARAASGIAIRGNAATWWNAAAGVYDRGNAPEAGSVLNFRSNERMRLGHVAVVTAIDDARHIEIEHANWGGPGAISRNIPVEDVSANNDWTAVRVGLGHTGEYGSVYPTYGFIYDRPDSGLRLAAQPYAEVAQAPDGPVHLDGRVAGVLDLSPVHGR